MANISDLPHEIRWHVLKYLQHPTADIMSSLIADYQAFQERYPKHKTTLLQYSRIYNNTFTTYCNCCGDDWDICQRTCVGCGCAYRDCLNECVDANDYERDADDDDEP